MHKLLPIILMLLTLGATPFAARADEVTRQVQEELRRRHLFFNEIDGRATPDMAAALRRYQERQGFPASGMADNVTLRSLGIIDEPAPPAEGNAEVLPDVPVLRSDSALPETTPRPALSPPPVRTAKARPITTAEASDFVRRYLAACESPNVQDELAFYADNVDYFDHGVVDRQYVKNELAVYNQRWPQRSYKMSNVRLAKSADNATAKFRVAFQVANSAANRKAAGKTDEAFGLSRRGDDRLEIVSIREERVRLGSHSRRRHAERDPVVRGVGKIFRSIFHR